MVCASVPGMVTELVVCPDIEGADAEDYDRSTTDQTRRRR